jgi:hypothetical protein
MKQFLMSNMTNIAHLCVIHTVPQSRTGDEDSNPEFIQTNKYTIKIHSYKDLTKKKRNSLYQHHISSIVIH